MFQKSRKMFQKKCSSVPVFQCSSVPVPKTASPEKKSRIFSRESNVDFWPAHPAHWNRIFRENSWANFFLSRKVTRGDGSRFFLSSMGRVRVFFFSLCLVITCARSAKGACRSSPLARRPIHPTILRPSCLELLFDERGPSISKISRSSSETAIIFVTYM